MSTEAGAGGIYGILMCEVTHKETVAVYEEFLERTANVEEEDAFDDITTQEWYSELYARLVKAFALEGIVIPEGACLIYTGKEEERPGICETPWGEWVLGFGLCTRPHQYPAMDTSFQKAANWHTWAWMSV